jgi:hypothetical protein
LHQKMNPKTTRRNLGVNKKGEDYLGYSNIYVI